MCDVKLVKLREIDVKKYVFKRALKETVIKNTTQNLEDWRMDKNTRVEQCSDRC